MSTWGWKKRDDRGAAAVEAAFCICFLVVPLVFATIAYAYMLSFRQTVTQAAAEGARAAAVAPSALSDGDRSTLALNAASTSMKTGPGGLNCNADNLVCTAAQTPCVGATTTNKCWKVTIRYPYRDHSLLPTIPGLGFSLPEWISYSAVVEVNN